MPTSCQINNENFESGKLRKDNNKRVSGVLDKIMMIRVWRLFVCPKPGH